MPPMTENRLALVNHWLLVGATPEQLEPLAGLARAVHLPPGQVIFREGDPADGLYLIVSGSVRVAASNSQDDVQVSVAHANDVVGEMGVLDGEPRSGTAMAVEPSAAYFLPAEPFLDVLERAPMVGMRLLGILARKLRETNTSLTEVAGMPENPMPVEEKATADDDTTLKMGTLELPKPAPPPPARPPISRPAVANPVLSELQKYLQAVHPLVETLDSEYHRWMELASTDGHTLDLGRDPTGQYAALYLWRGGQDTRKFTLAQPERSARQFYEAYALCLESREVAARLFKDAAEMAPVKNPARQISDANKKIVEGERQRERAESSLNHLKAG